MVHAQPSSTFQDWPTCSTHLPTRPPSPAGARDAHLFESPLPLAGLSTAFLSEDRMAAELPPAVYAAYSEALRQLQALVARGETQGADAPGGQLPWRRYGAGAGQHAARDATDWLAQQVEAAEQIKAHLR